HPLLANHDSVVFVRRLLLDSDLQDKAGEFDSAELAINSASTRIDALVASPPDAPAVLISQGAQGIRIFEHHSDQVARRSLSLIIANPDVAWTPTDTFTWTITPPGTIIASSVNLRAVRYRFDKAGPYTVNVMAHNVSQQRQIQIAPAPRKSTRQRVATRLQ